MEDKSSKSNVKEVNSEFSSDISLSLRPLGLSDVEDFMAWHGLVIIK